mmetsp:Transcript_30895/g.88888  ORF Transcript_30895/g.88888 Transcript_30895/m.88888 type:complete len:298 (-) Transcript_30895:557-1450(-)
MPMPRTSRQPYLPTALSSCRQHSAGTHTTRPNLLVFLLGLEQGIEARLRSQEGPPKPSREALRFSLAVHLDRDVRRSRPGNLLRLQQPGVDNALHVVLQPLLKVLERRGTTTQDNVVEEPSAVVNRAVHNTSVDHLWKRSRHRGLEDLGMEKNLRGQKTLIADLDVPGLLGLVVRPAESLKLPRILVKLLVFLHDILANVGMLLLDRPRRLHSLLRRHRFSAVGQHIGDKLRDVPTTQRDLLDARADDEAVGHGNSVRQAIARVHHQAGQIRASIRIFVVRIDPLSVESQHRLDSYV